jgi:hypothetical protein
MSTERPLKGCIVGISISESEDMERLGFDRGEMNRCVVRLSESLLAAGARLAFGHDWRPGGVMEAVAALAVRYCNVRRDARGQPTQEKAPILNRVAPPDVPFLAQEREAGAMPGQPANPMVRLLEGIVDAQQTGAPPGASRAEALGLMRKELARLCHVRVCLGGKLRGFQGTMPGIVEEALGTLREGRPVFTSGIFGGASRILVQAMSPEPIPFSDLPPAPEFPEPMAEIHALVPRLGRTLDGVEMGRLWRSTSIEQCIELTLRGAVAWWAENGHRYR